MSSSNRQAVSRLAPAAGSARSSEVAARQPLRVGILVDSLVQPRWVQSILEEIQRSTEATLALVVRNDPGGDSAGPPAGRLRRLWANRSHFLYALYSRVDDQFGATTPDAFAPSNVEALIGDCPVLTVRPKRTLHSDTLLPADVETIRSHNVDVLLRFGFRILRGGILASARHGVWSFHHDDPAVIRGGPPGFWEVMHGLPTTGSILQILTEDLDNGYIIYQSWAATISRFSVRRNRNNYYWKSASFVMRRLRGLYDGTFDIDAAVQARGVYRPYSGRLFRRPENGEMARLLFGLLRRRVTATLDRLAYFDQWALAFRQRKSANDTNNSLHRFRTLLPPKDRFWADPFPVKVNGVYYVFIEEYLYKTGKAHISVFQVDPASGKVSTPMTVLDRPYHLSYPCVFEWKGEFYMVPETGSNRNIELYRCTSFPHTWELDKVLIADLRAVDATITRVGDAWLMFTTIAVDGVEANWDELHIFHAPEPTGPWTPHRANPVKSDVRSSRPAGRPFVADEVLYRPAQDCSGGYGYAIAINRVQTQSAEAFVEKEVSRIAPEWDLRIKGTHTLNMAGDLTVVDCLVRRRRFF